MPGRKASAWYVTTQSVVTRSIDGFDQYVRRKAINTLHGKNLQHGTPTRMWAVSRLLPIVGGRLEVSDRVEINYNE